MLELLRYHAITPEHGGLWGTPDDFPNWRQSGLSESGDRDHRKYQQPYLRICLRKILSSASGMQQHDGAGAVFQRRQHRLEKGNKGPRDCTGALLSFQRLVRDQVGLESALQREYRAHAERGFVAGGRGTQEPSAASCGQAALFPGEEDAGTRAAHAGVGDLDLAVGFGAASHRGAGARAGQNRIDPARQFINPYRGEAGKWYDSSLMVCEWSRSKRKRTWASESTYPSTKGHHVLPQLRYSSCRRCPILPQMRPVRCGITSSRERDAVRAVGAPRRDQGRGRPVDRRGIRPGQERPGQLHPDLADFFPAQRRAAEQEKNQRDQDV